MSEVSTRDASLGGIRSYRKAALALAGGSTLVLAPQAMAASLDAADATTSADAAAISADAAAISNDAAATSTGAAALASAAADITVTGERYRINTLNSRLDDLRDAPQSISVIPRE